ncbi:TetR/AcrR family transcriptional regulator [Granulosicoccus antarcticus]|uniref:HTH tetR-type domain-containing protein n=1 Tax=Granulosicoccus antarcticus IMCC3135 TaxID=1192854 RepID=A0A2Z2NMU0_9GAMM|nr:TetR/AcrR family transcriptional regulator [Granulosicoccus antarcticus]ASJ70190.1 hypothetical protein IMCC3135_00320 [Granulosicoccus antarcticus IMCC3135]
MPAARSHKSPGSRQLWLDEAISLLKSNGVEAVKVMPLAQSLGLSRTGFYSHFLSREALLDDIISYWESKNTPALVLQANAYAQTISEAVLNLFDCWFDEAVFDAQLDMAIRNWARNEATLESRLKSADNERIQAVASVFVKFGFNQSQADVRAMTMIYTQIGYIAMNVQEPLLQRLERAPGYVEVMSGMLPNEEEMARFIARHTLISSTLCQVRS